MRLKILLINSMVLLILIINSCVPAPDPTPAPTSTAPEIPAENPTIIPTEVIPSPTPVAICPTSNAICSDDTDEIDPNSCTSGEYYCIDNGNARCCRDKNPEDPNQCIPYSICRKVQTGNTDECNAKEYHCSNEFEVPFCCLKKQPHFCGTQYSKCETMSYGDYIYKLDEWNDEHAFCMIQYGPTQLCSRDPLRCDTSDICRPERSLSNCISSEGDYREFKFCKKQIGPKESSTYCCVSGGEKLSWQLSDEITDPVTVPVDYGSPEINPVYEASVFPVWDEFQKTNRKTCFETDYISDPWGQIYTQLRPGLMACDPNDNELKPIVDLCRLDSWNIGDKFEENLNGKLTESQIQSNRLSSCIEIKSEIPQSAIAYIEEGEIDKKIVPIEYNYCRGDENTRGLIIYREISDTAFCNDEMKLFDIKNELYQNHRDWNDNYYCSHNTDHDTAEVITDGFQQIIPFFSDFENPEQPLGFTERVPYLVNNPRTCEFFDDHGGIELENLLEKCKTLDYFYQACGDFYEEESLSMICTMEFEDFTVKIHIYDPYDFEQRRFLAWDCGTRLRGNRPFMRDTYHLFTSDETTPQSGDRTQRCSANIDGNNLPITREESDKLYPNAICNPFGPAMLPEDLCIIDGNPKLTREPGYCVKNNYKTPAYKDTCSFTNEEFPEQIVSMEFYELVKSDDLPNINWLCDTGEIEGRPKP
ncbi:MAG: hypothetical protein KKF44_04665 [Nanoarchaeota archaeon]|nr:hypothetical protein [Nanoarchaeota archaeon]